MAKERQKYRVVVTTDTGAVSKVEYTTKAVMLPNVIQWLKVGWSVEIKTMQRV